MAFKFYCGHQTLSLHGHRKHHSVQTIKPNFQPGIMPIADYCLKKHETQFSITLPGSTAVPLVASVRKIESILYNATRGHPHSSGGEFDLYGMLTENWHACAAPWVLSTVRKRYSLQVAITPPSFNRILKSVTTGNSALVIRIVLAEESLS